MRPMEVKKIRRDSASSIVRRELKKLIRSGYFSGGMLPSEDSIASMFGVSRTTVRDALANLENLGYISRRQGKGTTVNQIISGLTCRISEGMPFTELISAQGYHASVRDGVVSKIPAPPEIVAKLRTSDRELYQIQKVFLGDNKPAIYGINYYPQDYLNDNIFNYPMDETTIFNILHQHFDFPEIAFDVIDIKPITAEGEIAQRLELPEGTPILFFESTSLDSHNVPLLVNREYYNPNMLPFCERRVTQYY